MNNTRKISVAPMIDWTDRHCRYFHRLMSKSVELYTEMIVDKAVIHGDAENLLDADADKDNVVLQLGGSDPKELGQAVKTASEFGYAHINLNCGCPSDRVQSGTFGAVLMKDPLRVEECLVAMREASDAEISIKCRLGIDDQIVEETLPDFLLHVERSGVKKIIIHARKAWLKGLSPKENRDIPPLDYKLAEKMIGEFKNLEISINGGVASIDEADVLLQRGFASVMIGRAAYQRPYDILSKLDGREFSRDDIARSMVDYADAHMQKGGRLHQVTRHMMGLYHGQPNGKKWRQLLSENASKRDATAQIILDSMPHQ